MRYSEEKRKFPRRDAALPLRYRKFDGNTYVSKGTLTKNLSEGGVRFNIGGFFPLACHLFVEMNLPSMSKSIKAISKIAWIRKLPSGERYEVGTHFLAMTSEDETTIFEFLRMPSKPR